jgi:two-component system response regulator LytT
MKIVIIEDEKLAVKNLTNLLKEIEPEITVSVVLDSVKNAIEWFSVNTEFDLIFMDIQLADDLSFKILEKTAIKQPIIFTTAYDHYAIQAFKVNSIDYLLKPLNKSELLQAIKKYKELKVFDQDNIRAFIQSLKESHAEYQKRFMITSGNKIKSVEVEDVAYFYSDGRYVKLICFDQSEHLIDFRMDKLEEILDPAAFFRINRNMIIHFKAIRQMHIYTKSRVKIDITPQPDFEVIASIDRSGAFKKWLNR